MDILVTGIAWPGEPKCQENETDYDIWQRNGQPLTPDSIDFWHPRSLVAEYSIKKGMRSSKGIGRKILTFLFAPIAIVLSRAAGTRINALPPKVWRLPMKAPTLPKPFMPQAKRYADLSEQFDEGCNAPADSLHKDRPPEADDVYASERAHGKGNAETEAALRYEQNGMLRMQARREGWVEKDQPVTAVDKPEEASREFNIWRKQEIQNYLAANIDTHATDHSTIMTNPEHAEKALAYDVAVGVCTIRQEQLRELRVAADWSLLKGTSFESGEFFEYYDNGTFKNASLFTWANDKDSPARKPKGIVDERQNANSTSNSTNVALRTDGA